MAGPVWRLLRHWEQGGERDGLFPTQPHLFLSWQMRGWGKKRHGGENGKWMRFLSSQFLISVATFTHLTAGGLICILPEKHKCTGLIDQEEFNKTYFYQLNCICQDLVVDKTLKRSVLFVKLYLQNNILSSVSCQLGCRGSFGQSPKHGFMFLTSVWKCLYVCNLLLLQDIPSGNLAWRQVCHISEPEL